MLHSYDEIYRTYCIRLPRVGVLNKELILNIQPLNDGIDHGVSKAADPHPFNADLDPASHLNEDSDPICHCMGIRIRIQLPKIMLIHAIRKP